MNPMLWIGVLLAGITALPLFAGEVTVIANPELQVSEISADELRAVFLGTKTSLKGTGVVQPVLKRSGPGLTEFSSEYLGKSESALRTYYRSLVFTGKWSMPVTLDSDAEVIAYVARTRGAIGFVNGGHVGQGVRAIKVK